ncbi:MAG: hypothetical protein ACREIA_22020 [Opitutaceae bacterium]
MILRLWLFVVLTLAGAFAPSRASARVVETRTWNFFPTATETRPESAPQVADSHLANPLHGYETASGCCLAAESGMKFGQATVKSTFAHGPHAGKTVGEVAAGIRSGAISPNSLPVEYVIRNGEAVALNNRSLLALRRAGVEPTVTRNMTGNSAAEALLDSHLRGGVPSEVIRVRGGPAGTSLIE